MVSLVIFLGLYMWETYFGSVQFLILLSSWFWAEILVKLWQNSLHNLYKCL